MLKVVQISKLYKDKVALNKVSIDFPDKGLVVIKGESGSGKTTLLNMLTALDYPTMGRVELDGVEITPQNGEDYRRKYCGNIYQDYMLIGGLTVRENIELGLQASGEDYTEEDIELLIDKMGLPKEYTDKKVSKLSGGEKQRVAIARAISKKHAMIFADEPTGNLDRRNGEKVMDILKDISKERLVVVVSHNEKFNAKYADYFVELVDGMIKSCNLPNNEGNESQSVQSDKKDFDVKSKLRPKTAVRLAYWGFDKNKGKTIASIVSFIMICILSLVFTVATLGDSNLAYASSIEKCKGKNVMTVTNGGYSSIFATDDAVSEDNIINFEESFDNKCSRIYSFVFYNGSFEKDSQKNSAYIEKFLYTPGISYGILYNSQIGMDVEVLYGDFPKEHNDIMLPNCLAKYLAEVSKGGINNIESMVGMEFKCANNTDLKQGRYYTFRICGIFEEGPYYTDCDLVDEDTYNYYNRTNMLAKSVVFSQSITDVWYNNPYSFGNGLGMSVLLNTATSTFIKNKIIYPYGYDNLSDYAKDYAELEYDEVYIEKSLAQSLSLNVGDVLEGTGMILKSQGFGSTSEKSDFDGLTVKGIIESDGRKDGVIFSQKYYSDQIVTSSSLENFKGFYFNMKSEKNVYGLLNKISSVGYRENLWMTSKNIDNVYTENLYATSQLWGLCVNMRYIAFLPVMLVLLIGLIALEYVSISYLLASKSKSYNVLRSLGFGRKSIFLILLLQVFTVIVIECVLGVSLGALCCHLFGMIFAGKTPANAIAEVPMPIGFIAPLIVVAISIVVGAIIVLAKTRSLFKKSVIENKTN